MMGVILSVLSAVALALHSTQCGGGLAKAEAKNLAFADQMFRLWLNRVLSEAKG